MLIRPISKIMFGVSSFVQQNVKTEDLNKANMPQYVQTTDTEQQAISMVNSLERQPEQDEYIKEVQKNQERYQKELEEKRIKFGELINKPQKYTKGKGGQ